jgi:hypothetical protein
MSSRITLALLGALALTACQGGQEAGSAADTGTGAFTESIDTAATRTDTGMVRLDTLKREPRP